MLVDFNEGAAAIFASASDVSAERLLTVEEIIARHQQQQRAQDALVRNYIASARTEQHFRPTMTDPGYDVVTENRYFVGADGIEWEELSFSVNGSKWGADRPPFPLLQPEKVLSLPLQLRFDNDYRYRLAGHGARRRLRLLRRALRAARRPAQSLYRGTVWIDRKTFARVQGAGGAERPVGAGRVERGDPDVRAGHVDRQPPDLPVHRAERAADHADCRAQHPASRSASRSTTSASTIRGFDEARTAARRGDAIMYRETDRGLRYYVKQGDARVVSDRATRTARAMAMGVTLDPSYAFPLPIFGINYLDFEFRGRPDTQLAMLFAGVLAAGNIQRPKLGGDAASTRASTSSRSPCRRAIGSTTRQASARPSGCSPGRCRPASTSAGRTRRFRR